MVDRGHSYGNKDGTHWTPRERGGYWRQYEGVANVSNRLRATREPNGHRWAAGSSRASGPGASSQPVTQASGKGTTPSKSSDNSA